MKNLLLLFLGVFLLFGCEPKESQFESVGSSLSNFVIIGDSTFIDVPSILAGLETIDPDAITGEFYALQSSRNGITEDRTIFLVKTKTSLHKLTLYYYSGFWYLVPTVETCKGDPCSSCKFKEDTKGCDCNDSSPDASCDYSENDIIVGNL